MTFTYDPRLVFDLTERDRAQRLAGARAALRLAMRRFEEQAGVADDALVANMTLCDAADCSRLAALPDADLLALLEAGDE